MTYVISRILLFTMKHIKCSKITFISQSFLLENTMGDVTQIEKKITFVS
jgi:hypothetical protein